MDVAKYRSTFYRTRPDGGLVLQPYLLYCTDDYASGQFYLKANNATFHIGPCALRAFDIIIKYHTVFDLEYDLDLTHFYHFMEFIFNMRSTLPPKMSTFLSTLQCVG